ncbi:hypothetical protein HAX54_023709, partial [Datura stramonium]|nr:hypothetical protein [Datura stramonium]
VNPLKQVQKRVQKVELAFDLYLVGANPIEQVEMQYAGRKPSVWQCQYPYATNLRIPLKVVHKSANPSSHSGDCLC